MIGKVKVDIVDEPKVHRVSPRIAPALYCDIVMTEDTAAKIRSLNPHLHVRIFDETLERKKTTNDYR